MLEENLMKKLLILLFIFSIPLISNAQNYFVKNYTSEEACTAADNRINGGMSHDLAWCSLNKVNNYNLSSIEKM